LNESLLGFDLRVDPIVLRSEWRFNGKHYFSREPYKIDHRIIVPFQQLFSVSQTGDAVGFRQLLRTTSLEALELKITVNDPMDTDWNGECQFHVRFGASIGAFWACSTPDSVQGHPLSMFSSVRA